MSLDAIKRIRNNISRILPPSEKVSTSENKHYNDDSLGEVPDSLVGLPLFSSMKTLCDKKEEVLMLQSDQKLKQHLKLQEKIQGLVGHGVELSEDIAASLEFMHNSSQILKQALENPMTQNAIPLPHHLHRKMVDMMEACIWMIQNKRWQPLDNEVDWNSLLYQLQEDVAYWMSCSKQTEKTLKEVEDLKQKLDTIIQSYSNISYKPEIC